MNLSTVEIRQLFAVEEAVKTECKDENSREVSIGREDSKEVLECAPPNQNYSPVLKSDIKYSSCKEPHYDIEVLKVMLDSLFQSDRKLSKSSRSHHSNDWKPIDSSEDKNVHEVKEDEKSPKTLRPEGEWLGKKRSSAKKFSHSYDDLNKLLRCQRSNGWKLRDSSEEKDVQKLQDAENLSRTLRPEGEWLSKKWSSTKNLSRSHDDLNKLLRYQRSNDLKPVVSSEDKNIHKIKDDEEILESAHPKRNSSKLRNGPKYSSYEVTRYDINDLKILLELLFQSDKNSSKTLKPHRSNDWNPKALSEDKDVYKVKDDEELSKTLRSDGECSSDEKLSQSLDDWNKPSALQNWEPIALSEDKDVYKLDDHEELSKTLRSDGEWSSNEKLSQSLDDWNKLSALQNWELIALSKDKDVYKLEDHEELSKTLRSDGEWSSNEKLSQSLDDWNKPSELQTWEPIASSEDKNVHIIRDIS